MLGDRLAIPQHDDPYGPREGHINNAYLLRTIAKHWVKDESCAEALRVTIKNLTDFVRKGAGKGMTDKNRGRVSQFNLPQNVDALIRLPLRVWKEVVAKPRTPTLDAVRVMRALQVAILTYVPIRLKNLTELQLGVHVIDTGKGAKREVRIQLSRDDTKNYAYYHAPLPKHLLPLLDSWLKAYRPATCALPSNFLFPNRRGERRSQGSVGSKISSFVARETGLKVNPHLFRHIAAKLYLDANPTEIEVVRQFLGHKSIKTTLAFYAELQTDPAFDRMRTSLLDVGYRLSRKAPRRHHGEHG